MNDSKIDIISKKIKVIHLVLLIALIIIVIPIILTFPAFINHLNFSDTGEIGDTLGGITAPFLNGIAAILVFIAFKAQIKANEIVTNQFEFNQISGQIERITDDKFNVNNMLIELKKYCEYIKTKANYNKDYYILHLNRILYSMTDFHLLAELIPKYDGNKEILWRKLYYAYAILFKDTYDKIGTELKGVLNKTEALKYESEIISEINYLNEKIDDLNKYSTSPQQMV